MPDDPTHIEPMDETTEIDLIGYLIRTMTDRDLVEADAPWMFEVARGLAWHLLADFAVVDRSRLQPAGCGHPDHGQLEHNCAPFLIERAEEILTVPAGCDRHRRAVGHKPHDSCPGHPGRYLPAEQLAAAPDQP